MNRGEIGLIDLGPSQQGEAATGRPAMVVSNDGAKAIAAIDGALRLHFALWLNSPWRLPTLDSTRRAVRHRVW